MNSKKRYYKENEWVWMIEDQEAGMIKAIDLENLQAIIQPLSNIKEKQDESVALKFWEIDKLKYKAREDVKEELAKIFDKSLDNSNILSENNDGEQVQIMVSLLTPDAKMPTKRKEDAGWDLYPSIQSDENGVSEMYLKKGETAQIPTGLAFAVSDDYYINTKHERGSTGKLGMNVHAGVVDSGYRGEVFLLITPLQKNIIITSEVEEVEEYEETILYPYSKAIAQATINRVPNVEMVEIDYDSLLKIESERGTDSLGSTN